MNVKENNFLNGTIIEHYGDGNYVCCPNGNATKYCQKLFGYIMGDGLRNIVGILPSGREDLEDHVGKSVSWFCRHLPKKEHYITSSCELDKYISTATSCSQFSPLPGHC